MLLYTMVEKTKIYKSAQKPALNATTHGEINLTEAMELTSKIACRNAAESFLGRMLEEEVIALSEKITGHVLSIAEVRNAETLFTYLHTGKEPRTYGSDRTLASTWMGNHKRVLVPKIIGLGIMKAVELRHDATFAVNRLGITEPLKGKVYDGPLDVCIAPGLMFDAQGGRVGSGGGYYDRYLAEYHRRHPAGKGRKELVLIGLAYSVQVMRAVLMQEHDYRMHYVVTEQGVIDARR